MIGRFKGLFDLQGPRDLLEKLRHDYHRLEDLPNVHPDEQPFANHGLLTG